MSPKEVSASPSAPEEGVAVTVKAVFNVPPKVLYRVFTDEDELTRLGLGRKCQMTPEPGAGFSLFNGSLTGRVLKLEPPNLIEWALKRDDWGSHTSHVKIGIEELSGTRSRINILQSQIPSDGSVSVGTIQREILHMWESSFFDILDKCFGYGRDKIDEDDD